MFIMIPLSSHTYSRWSSCCLHSVVWLTILHTCKHTGWCCSGSPSHCLNVCVCVWLYPRGRRNGRHGRAGVRTWASAQVDAPLPRPLSKVRAAAQSPRTFPWENKVSGDKLPGAHCKQTPLCEQASLFLCLHTGAFCCSLVRWRPLS